MFGNNQPLTEYFSSGQGVEIKKFVIARKAMIISAMAVILGGYCAATIVSSAMVNFLMGNIAKPHQRAISGGVVVLNKGQRFNYVKMRRAIMNRNVFNSAAEFPDETSLVDANAGDSKQVFDPHSKCRKSRLNISLLGTIYMGNPDTSMATIKESGYDVADIYRAGDFIIGNDDAQIVAIIRKKVVINNNGVKECIELVEKKLPQDLAFDPIEDQSSLSAADKEKLAFSESKDGCIVFDGNYVEEELGEGFSKILTAARLVPNMENNTVTGFKIFAINQSSLLGKSGFKNGDVITQVNDTSLKLLDRGFALYEAFQNERDLRIHIMRGGKTPKLLCVKIK